MLPPWDDNIYSVAEDGIKVRLESNEIYFVGFIVPKQSFQWKVSFNCYTQIKSR